MQAEALEEYGVLLEVLEVKVEAEQEVAEILETVETDLQTQEAAVEALWLVLLGTGGGTGGSGIVILRYPVGNSINIISGTSPIAADSTAPIKIAANGDGAKYIYMAFA